MAINNPMMTESVIVPVAASGRPESADMEIVVNSDHQLTTNDFHL